MALINITDDRVTLGDTLILGAGGDLLIAATGSLRELNDEAVNALASGQSVTVNGALLATDAPALRLGDSDTDTDLALTVGKGGIVMAESPDDTSTEAVNIQGKNVSVVNAGTISGHETAISLTVAAGGVARITNSGVILSSNNALNVFGNSEGRVVLTNSGKIAGDVAGTDQNDVFVNKGVIIGRLEMQDGNDFYDGRGGRVSSSILGFDGSDRFILGGAAEDINGGGDFDTLDFRNSNGAQMSLDGSLAGTGVAKGDDYFGIEQVFGSLKGADRLRGDALSNDLRGFGGNDRLEGQAGADQLVGGAGRDVLTGGSGGDTFRFNSLSDRSDRITDFSQVDDVLTIDASGFGLGSGAGAFLAVNRFRAGNFNEAKDADDRFIFRTGDETLWFDRDGKGGKGPVLIADLQDGAVMSAADIFLFA